MSKVVKILFLCTLFSTTCKAASEPMKVNNIKIGDKIIPSTFVYALEQGMAIPVFLNYTGNRSETKIANANIIISDNKIKLVSIEYLYKDNEATLSDDVLLSMEKLKSQFFDKNMIIEVDNDATLYLDILSFNLDLNIKKSAFAVSRKNKSNKLGPSSVDNTSTILNYNLGVYNNINKEAKNNSNSYLNINTLTSFAENHLNIDASLYQIGKSNQQSELYRAMVERDYQGYRIALGLLSTWNMQSIATISALSSSKVYGVSFGNKSSSIVNKTSSSLTPIYAFLSSPGEVRIYRQNKLLSIQNFPMGNYEVDTTILPFGIYDVTVESVIDGKVASTKTQTINKTFGALTTNLNKLDWEVYGGYVDYENAKHIIEYNEEEQKLNHNNRLKKTYVVGLSAATTLDFLSGLSLQMSNYTFDKHLVMEAGTTLSLTPDLSLAWQTLVSNKGTFRNIITASAQLPKNTGSLWASKEKTSLKLDIPIYESNNYSYGANVNLNEFIEKSGTFTISRTHDNRYKSDSVNYEYGNNIYSGKYGNFGIRLGVQKYQYDNQENINEKFISLDFSLPLSTWLSTGISSTNNNIKANIYANKTFNDSFITSAGGAVSKLIKEEDNSDSDFSALGYATYNAKYSTGTLTVNRPDNERFNGNYTASGSLAYSDGLVGVSGNAGSSGIIINPNIEGGGAMTAQVNGQNYQITGKRTFIPLQPYSDYHIELMNSGKSMDSFDILSGRNKSVTLYPGNVAIYTPNVRKLITVFGRMKSPNGQLLADTPIKNHIGKTKTDANGEFSMDIDTRYPVITVFLDNNINTICEADLNLKDAKGALWLGDVICENQSSLAKQ